MSIKELFGFLKKQFREKTLMLAGICLGCILFAMYLVGYTCQVTHRIVTSGYQVTMNPVQNLALGFFTPIPTIIFGLAIFLLVLSFYAFYARQPVRDERGVIRSDTTEYGANHPMTGEEMKEVFRVQDVEDTKKFILGKTKDGKVVTYDPASPIGSANGHWIVCAGSGRGKSTCVLAPNIYQAIRRGSSYVVIDTSGELYEWTAAVARHNDYNVKILNIRNCALSDGFNMMALLDDETIGNPVTVAQKLTAIIVANMTQDQRRDFWTDISEGLLVAGMVMVHESSKTPGGYSNDLPSVYYFFARPAKEITADFANVSRTHPAYLSAQDYMAKTETVQQSAVGGLNAYLKTLLDESMRQMMQYEDIDLKAPGTEKCAYYLEVPDQDMSRNWIASVFVGSMLLSLVEGFAVHQRGDKALPNEVVFMLDEFVNTVKVPDWSQKMNTLRKYNIAMHMYIQNVPMMKDRFGPDLYKSIMDACDTHLFLGTNENEDTADYYSRKSGSETYIVEGKTRNRGFLFNRMQVDYTEKIQKAQRPVYYPSELVSLSSQETEEIIFLATKNPLKEKRFFYKDHPMYQELTEIGMEFVEDNVPFYKRSGKPIVRHYYLKGDDKRKNWGDTSAGNTKQFPVPESENPTKDKDSSPKVEMEKVPTKEPEKTEKNNRRNKEEMHPKQKSPVGTGFYQTPDVDPDVDDDDIEFF